MSDFKWFFHARRRLQLRLNAVLILAMLALIGAEASTAWTTRQSTLATARAETTNLARSLADDVSGDFQSLDTILVGLRERVVNDGATPAALKRLRAFLKTRSAALPMLHSVLVLDAAGRLLVSADDVLTPGMIMAKSATFLHHRDSTDPGMFVSPPSRNIIDGRWVIKISRRVDKADGTFAGIVIACVTTDFFEAFFSKFDTGQKGVILMARREGVPLARSPHLPDFIGRDVSQGTLFKRIAPGKREAQFESTSPIDGTLRLSSFREVPGTPIILAVGHSKSKLLAAWRTTTAYHMLGLCLVGALFWHLGRRLLLKIAADETARRMLQQTVARVEQSKRQLTTANRRLAMAQQIANVGHWSVDLINAHTVTWSEEVFHIHGRNPETFIPDLQTGIAAYHPDDQAEVAAAIADTIATGAPFNIEVRLLRPDGDIRHIKSRGMRELDGLGTPQAVFGVFIDVTEQKKAELAMLQANADANAANQILATSNRALETLALKDSLTGLANRRHFDTALEHEFQHARRNADSLALILIDVDRFKQFNDAYGHPAGDSCLRTIAQTIQPFACRTGDLASRYGGEEMALLLPNCTESQAVAIGARIVSAIRDLAMPHNGSAGGIVTISAGIAAFVPLHASLKTELVEQADAALYGAKRAGRDRVVGFSEGWGEGDPPPRPPVLVLEDVVMG